MKSLFLRINAAVFLMGFLFSWISPASWASSSGLERMIESNNTFSVDLYLQLKETEGNLFFSPYSVSTALAMTYAGARAQTADHMAKALHFALNPEELGSCFHELQNRLNAAQKKHEVELHVANSLWPQKGYPFLTAYIDMITRQYNAPVTPLDYVKAREQARVTINRWVEKKTGNRIKELIGRGTLDRLTILVLVNAIYFKGTWLIPFDKSQTKEAPFVMPDGRQVRVSLMYRKGRFRYGESKHSQIIELPYGVNSLSMFVVLPRHVKGLAALERGLSMERLKKWTASLQRKEVKVHLPKFNITWGTRDLKLFLKKLGMHDPFVLGKADFSGMTRAEPICISLVLHKAFVDVNEEGTEAGAATAVAARRLNGGKRYTFRADHSFLFFIRDNKTGAVLFMGRVVRPAAVK
jgi:serpin B